MLLEYLATGQYAWLVQIVFLVCVAVGTAVYVGNKQAYKLRQLNLAYEEKEATAKRRMEQLVVEHAKPGESTAVAVIEHGADRPKRRSRRQS